MAGRPDRLAPHSRLGDSVPLASRGSESVNTRSVPVSTTSRPRDGLDQGGWTLSKGWAQQARSRSAATIRRLSPTRTAALARSPRKLVVASRSVLTDHRKHPPSSNAGDSTPGAPVRVEAGQQGPAPHSCAGCVARGGGRPTRRLRSGRAMRRLIELTGSAPSGAATARSSRGQSGARPLSNRVDTRALHNGLAAGTKFARWRLIRANGHYARVTRVRPTSPDRGALEQ